MTDHVEEERVAITIAAHGGNSRPETAVHCDWNIEFLSFAPERIVGRVVEAPPIERIGPDEHRLEAKLAYHTAHLADCFVHALHRHRRDAEQPIRKRLA